jgi:hypothetical protein
MTTETTHQDSDLAAKIIAAMKEVDASEAVRKEKVIIAGKLLAEAHKHHPTDEAFKKFLALAGGIQIRRAQEMIAIALGRKDFEQHQAENAAKQQRHRDKLKAERDKAKAALPKPNGKSEPKRKADVSAFRQAAARVATDALRNIMLRVALCKACLVEGPAMSMFSIRSGSMNCRRSCLTGRGMMRVGTKHLRSGSN